MGTEHIPVIRLKGWIGLGTQARFLSDSGAGANFIDEALARRAGLAIQPSSRVVRLADGTERSACGTVRASCILPSASASGAPLTFTAEFCVTRLKGYDAILGTPWLNHFGPVVIDTQRREVTVRPQGAGSAATLVLQAADDDTPREPPPTAAATLEEARARCELLTQTAMRKEFKRQRIDLSSVELLRLRLRPEGTPTLSAAEQRAEDPGVTALKAEFADVMPAELPPGLPKERGVEHSIELVPGAKPHAPPIRRYSPAEDAVIQQKVQEQLEKGHIRESTSPWGAMVLLARKKDGTMRFCVDYRVLNNQTVKDSYALPLQDDLFDRAQGCRYFTCLDLHSGFWQIRLSPGSIPLTAFRTRNGHYEYTVLPMGLCNAPSTFMRMMNTLLRGKLSRFAVAFLDDVFIFSRTREEHLQHLREVLELLRAQGLYLKPSKCEWMKDEVEFLGHRIGRNGLSVDPAKIDAIRQWPQPADASQLRSFLGLAGYYRRFIEQYSHVATPLTELTKDDAAWRWEAPQQRAFDELKQRLGAAPTLLLADPSKPYVLHTDASGYALGAVLMQDQGQGLQPVSYLSSKMKDAETRYAPHEQELLALVYACKRWRCYLHGQPFTILSDHQSLRYFSTQPLLSARQARWKDALADFDFTIKYLEGPKNVVADALSRRPDHQPAASLERLLQRQSSEASRDQFLAALQMRSELDQPGPFTLQETMTRLAALSQLAAAASHRGARPAESADAARGREQAREEARRAARENRPLDPDRGAPDAKGEVRMPSQRCTADNKQGGQCGARTRHGEYCWQHLVRLGGVRIRPSTIKDAGMGLFAARPVRRGERIAKYTGDLVPADQLTEDGPLARSGYLLELSERLSLDAARTNTAPGRLVNDARGSGRRNNVKFVCNQNNKTVTLVTLRAIKQGEELLVRYGPASYWAKRQAQRPEQLRYAGDTRAEGPEPIEIAATEAATVRYQLLDDMRSAAKDDSVYAGWLAQPATAPRGTEVRDGLLWRGARLCVPDSAALRTRAIAECHDTAQGGHFGRDASINQVERRFHWTGLAADVAKYVATCDTCQRCKAPRGKTPGLLMPLPVPEELDSHWTMDFVTGLPKTARGYDAIQGHFSRGGGIKRVVPARTTDTAADVAQRFVDSVVRNHGVPRSIVSDRDPRFKERGFWDTLWARLGTTLSRSTGYHAQTDGLSEREQQTMKQWLVAFCEQRPADWDLMLSMGELALNTKPKEPTGTSAFRLLYGRDPATTVDRALSADRPDDAPAADASVPAAEQRHQAMRETWEWSRGGQLLSQERMRQQANKHRREVHYKVGDLVLLSTKHLTFKDGRRRKLSALWCGPFPVSRVINDNAYELELPEVLQIHRTINVTFLRPYLSDGGAFPGRPQAMARPPPEATDSNGAPVHEVERVLSHRGGARTREYLVLWKGYPYEESTWESADDCSGARQALAAYWAGQRRAGSRAQARDGDG